jgi:hypothetical protein
VANAGDITNINPRSGQLTRDPTHFLGRSEVIYSSYAGVDIVAQMVLPGEPPITLGELQTISYSIHRENRPLRIIGHVSPASFAKGPRTIAGSLIFTQFNEYAFYRLQSFRDIINKRNNQLYPLADMLPPFDVVLSFSNELGSFSKLKIYGITIIDEGGTMSVDDLITEQTYTYMARGIQPMTHYLPAGFNAMPEQINESTPDRNTLRFL